MTDDTATPAEIALVLAHAEGLKADRWQPIETAPKDRQILLFCPFEAPGAYSVQIGEWFAALHYGAGVGWWGYVGQPGSYSKAHQPTHWLPLPAPPDSQPTRDDLVTALERVCRGADHWYAQREEQGQ